MTTADTRCLRPSEPEATMMADADERARAQVAERLRCASKLGCTDAVNCSDDAMVSLRKLLRKAP